MNQSFKLKLLLLALILFNSPTPALAEKLLKSIPFDGYEMIISEIDENTLKVNLVFEKAPTEVTGFIVENPNRIVIDIFGMPSRTARGTNIDSNKLRKVRVGIHQDKTRIVLDSPVKSPLEISQSGNISSPVFLITFPGAYFEAETPVLTPAPSETPTPAPSPEPTLAPTEEPTREPTREPTLAPTATPTPEPTPSPTPSPTPESTPAPTPSPSPTPAPATPSPTPEPTPEPTKAPSPSPTPSPVATATPLVTPPATEPPDTKKPDTKKEVELQKTAAPELSPEVPKESLSITEIEESIKEIETKDKDVEVDSDGNAIVKTIVFQTTSDNFISSIVISATSLGAYTMNKIAPGEYELSLTRSRLKGPHLELPQFPPDSFKGFTYVRASEKDDAVFIHIYVDEGVRLTPYIAQDKLWVKAE